MVEDFWLPFRDIWTCVQFLAIMNMLIHIFGWRYTFISLGNRARVDLMGHREYNVHLALLKTAAHLFNIYAYIPTYDSAIPFQVFIQEKIRHTST